MHKTHSLKTLNGMNPRTARRLFDLLTKEWNGVTWDDFRKFCGSDLACFHKESRWIPGDLFRNYFASLDGGAECGRDFVRLYSNRTHKSGSESDRTKPSKSKRAQTRAVLSSALAAVAGEIIAQGSTRELVERLTAISGSLLNLSF